MAGILNTGISALQSFQRQLATTGHNISNVNTEGYSRQTVQLETRDAFGGSSGYIGTGVNTAAITRSYDTYLADRVRAYTSSNEEYEIYHDRASQIDNVIGDAAAGVNEMMSQFFSAVQDVADDPTAIPAREVVLNRAELLSDRFQSLDAWMESLRRQTNQDMEIFTNEMNGLAESIADVNIRIQTISTSVSNPPNDLLDERDNLIDQMSQYTNVTTVNQDDGSVNVFIGTGQSMVVGGNANTLSVSGNTQATDYKQVNLVQIGGSSVTVTDQMTGGKLGGLVKFRDEVLDATHNALGRVAIGFAQAFNSEHNTGMDLDGDFGGDFFAVATPQLLDNGTNTGVVAATFDDIGSVTTHEYQLSYDGAAWSLTDLYDNSTVAMTGAGSVGSPFVADGLSFVMDGAEVAGDTYRVRPTRLGSTTIERLVDDARDIAAAETVIAEDAVTNAGTGHITEGNQVTSTGTTPLAAPITMTFNNVTNQFTLSSGGTFNYDPTTDSGITQSVAIAGIGDFEFSITGTPANGDQYTLTDNAGGVGDNRNAQRLSDLQTSNIMLGGTATLADTYGFLVSNVGTRTSQAEANAGVQAQLRTQAENSKDAVVGVNLDEEAADLVRFQQAYQAAAQVISTANSLFDTLIGAVRR